jgi:hypothetical protein
MTPAEVAAWTAASRARQGLGPKITDPVILHRIAILAFTTTEAEGEGGDRGAA